MGGEEEQAIRPEYRGASAGKGHPVNDGLMSAGPVVR